MPRTRLTRKRIAFGVALIIIGLIILDVSLRLFVNTPLIFPAVFMFTIAICFGWAVMASFPIKTLLKSLFLLGLWYFLFIMPIMSLSLPLETKPLVLGFSFLLLVLIVIGYEKWKKKKLKKTSKVNH